ncbi:MAG: cell division protein FtsQ/DivIB [Deltaproteobacteria bacterium]|nr:cell division protein FtsQ/DivIB [Deltaproteobacteria bacterium]
MSPILEQQEIAKKPKHRLRRLFRKAKGPLRWILTGVAFVLVGAGVWFGICHSSLFNLQKIGVVGDLKQLTTDEVTKASALVPGINLFQIVLGDVEKRVSKLPWASVVSVRREAPQTLWIHVTEQKPKALLLSDKLYFVSGSGVVFKPVEQESCRDLPVLTGLTPSDSLTEAMELIRFLENSADFELFGLSEIHYNDANGFSIVTLKGPMEVKLGKKEFESKIMRLKKIWPELEAALGHIHGIDLDYEDRAVVKL